LPHWLEAITSLLLHSYGDQRPPAVEIAVLTPGEGHSANHRSESAPPLHPSRTIVLPYCANRANTEGLYGSDMSLASILHLDQCTQVEVLHDIIEVLSTFEEGTPVRRSGVIENG
jgi:hypothetical protein